MSAAAHTATVSAVPTGIWDGGREPFSASFGKLMMWFFLLSDAFTFSALLISYGLIRISHTAWPSPEIVFNALPFLGHGNYPLIFVGIMTFILILSSVTMVLAVEAGHRNDRQQVLQFLLLTVIGGAAFLGCQAWEWAHLIEGGTTISGNPYGSQLFGQLFFVITGFHGFHVFSGLVILMIVTWATAQGIFDRRGHYEMIEKVGLYWHFVDLVWVFVFTCFYLV
jgi:cytochrome c oxidase subunit III